MSDPEGDGEGEKVGYGKPPKHSRFKPGPDPRRAKGRKKGSQNFSTMLGRVLSDAVDVNVGGRRRKMTQHEVILRAVVAKAMKSDIAAARHVHELYAANLLPKEVEALEQALSTEDAEILADFIARHGGCHEA